MNSELKELNQQTGNHILQKEDKANIGNCSRVHDNENQVSSNIYCVYFILQHFLCVWQVTDQLDRLNMFITWHQKSELTFEH